MALCNHISAQSKYAFLMTVGLLVAFITLWLNHSRRSTCGDQSLLSGRHCGSLDILWTKLIHGQSTHSQVIGRILANRRCQSTVVAVHTPAYAGSAVLIDELTRLNTIFCDIVFVARLGAWSVGSIVHFLWSYDLVPSVLWCCWLGGRKGIRPVKKQSGGVLAWLSSGARCRLAYGPADATATHCLLLQ